MSGSGELRLYDVRQVHAGPLNDVFRAHCGGRHVAIKRRATSTRWDDVIASSWQLASQTRVFAGVQLGWPHDHAALDAAHADRLLRAEHALLAQVAIDWNHPGGQLARWASDDVLRWTDRDDAGALCLVMPWCEGEPLSALPRDVQRRLYPTMLPALWRALGECPHGDLGPENLLIERRRWFRILDPGTRVTGPVGPAASAPAPAGPAAHAAQAPLAGPAGPGPATQAAHAQAPQPGTASASPSGALALTSSLFTTNPAHYPLLAPEHGPGWPHLRAPAGGLVQLLEQLTAHPQLALLTADPRSVPLDAIGPPPSSPYTPTAADVFACGAIYFEILAGAPLSSILALDAPLWTRAGAQLATSELARQREAVAWCVTQITGGAVRRALEPVGAARPEITLCERLILLDLDAQALAALVGDIARLAV